MRGSSASDLCAYAPAWRRMIRRRPMESWGTTAAAPLRPDVEAVVVRRCPRAESQQRIAYRMPASQQPARAILAVRERRPRPASCRQAIAAPEARHERRRPAAPGTAKVIERAAGRPDSTVPAAVTASAMRPVTLLLRVAKRREARRWAVAAAGEEKAAATSACASSWAQSAHRPRRVAFRRPSSPTAIASPRRVRPTAERETRCRTPGSVRVDRRNRRARRRRQGTLDIRRESPWGPRSSGGVDRVVVGCSGQAPSINRITRLGVKQSSANRSLAGR